MAKRKQGKKKPARKPTEGGSKISAERLKLVAKLMASSVRKIDIVQRVVKEYGVTRKTAYIYCQKVEEEWRQDIVDADKPSARGECLAHVNEGIFQCFTSKKMSTLPRLIELKMRLLDIVEPDRIVITPDEHPTESMTSAQLRAYNKQVMIESEMFIASLAKFKTKNEE